MKWGAWISIACLGVGTACQPAATPSHDSIRASDASNDLRALNTYVCSDGGASTTAHLRVECDDSSGTDVELVSVRFRMDDRDVAQSAAPARGSKVVLFDADVLTGCHSLEVSMTYGMHRAFDPPGEMFEVRDSAAVTLTKSTVIGAHGGPRFVAPPPSAPFHQDTHGLGVTWSEGAP